MSGGSLAPLMATVPLHAMHERLGARFVPFGGFDMPVQYSGILAEHAAVRTAAGLFDVSHMSNLWVEGPGAEELLSRTLAADPKRLKQGRAQYTVACKEDGTIIDDLIFYRFGPQRFHVLPNAGMNATFLDWFSKHKRGDVKITDVSRSLAILALQGPKARKILESVLPHLAAVKRFGFIEWTMAEGSGFVSGTGYTGEDGVELILPNAAAERVWSQLMEAGQEAGLVPCGLGARDTLRLEKGFCLAPHEFKGGRSPLEAGLEWVVHWEHDFIGRAALESQKAAGTHDRLVALRASGRGIPREGCLVEDAEKEVGVVTSGTLSPTLRTGIALAYVRPQVAGAGTGLGIRVRDALVACQVVKPPFC
jgi:aminomethyltransferase